MTRRALTWGLIASVTLNVLVVGAVVGALLTQSGRPDRSGGRDFGGPPEVRTIARGLDGESRRALFRGLREDAVLREGRQRLRANRGEIAAALRAEPFDPAAFEAALAARRAAQADLAARGSSALAGVIASLSQEARIRLADQLSRRR